MCFPLSLSFPLYQLLVCESASFCRKTYLFEASKIEKNDIVHQKQSPFICCIFFRSISRRQQKQFLTLKLSLVFDATHFNLFFDFRVFCDNFFPWHLKRLISAMVVMWLKLWLSLEEHGSSNHTRNNNCFSSLVNHFLKVGQINSQLNSEGGKYHLVVWPLVPTCFTC